MKYEIDAKGKKIGRVASEVASILLGKKTPDFAKNVVAKNTVHVSNVASLSIGAKKKDDNIYVTYTGWRGGINREKLGELINRRGISEVLKRAVYNMLPANKLRTERMKNLIISE